MAAGAPPLAGVGDRGSSSSSSHPPPPPPPKILLAKPPLPPPSSSGADDDGGGGGGAGRSRQATQPGSLSLVSDAWEVHTDKILPVRASSSGFATRICFLFLSFPFAVQGLLTGSMQALW